MPTFSRSVLQSTFAAAVFCLASASHAQDPQLPPPESTDPVALELMKGFPSPPDKIVRLATVLKYPERTLGFSSHARTRPHRQYPARSGRPIGVARDSARAGWRDVRRRQRRQSQHRRLGAQHLHRRAAGAAQGKSGL
ncbi:hypothetical protein LP417_02020 [Polaromonas sp. P1-6]|nr:hypothetical protein LP417_02020 [Polaromonas sp. P1-6]